MIYTWPPSKDTLADLYTVQRMDCVKIGAIFSKNPKTIWKYLQRFGIQTRPRGAESGHSFKKGDVSPFKGKKHTEENKEKIRQQRLIDGHVPYLKNGVHWLKQDGAKSPNWQGGLTPERQRVYSSEEWTSLVKEIWARDNAICQRCGLDYRTVSKDKIKFHIHHKVSFQKKAWRMLADNLILVCGPCHRWIHSKENTSKEFIVQLKKAEVPSWVESRSKTK